MTRHTDWNVDHRYRQRLAARSGPCFYREVPLTGNVLLYRIRTAAFEGLKPLEEVADECGVSLKKAREIAKHDKLKFKRIRCKKFPLPEYVVDKPKKREFVSKQDLFEHDEDDVIEAYILDHGPSTRKQIQDGVQPILNCGKKTSRIFDRLRVMEEIGEVIRTPAPKEIKTGKRDMLYQIAPGLERMVAMFVHSPTKLQYSFWKYRVAENTGLSWAEFYYWFGGYDLQDLWPTPLPIDKE